MTNMTLHGKTAWKEHDQYDLQNFVKEQNKVLFTKDTYVDYCM